MWKIWLIAVVLAIGGPVGPTWQVSGAHSANFVPHRATSTLPPPSCHAAALACLERQRLTAIGTSVKKDTKLSWPLAQLSDANAEAQAAGRRITSQNMEPLPKPLRDLSTARLMRLDHMGRVQVFVRTTDSAELVASRLKDIGVGVERFANDHDLVQAWVPIPLIRSITAVDGVEQMRLPDYGFTQTGSVLTQGDGLLNAAAARSTFGIDGTGVRVGVISDGVEGLAASQASGDLPTVNTTTCNVVPQSPTSSGAGAEGTAMLEIVHDLAPGAELWFGHFAFGFSGTVLDFMAAVNCLADNVDVVVDDIGWYNVGSYDGTGIVSQNVVNALNDPANRIRGYYNAVGNDALSHYQEPFVDSGFDLVAGPDFWDQHLFAATSNTTDAGLGLPCGCADAITLEPGGVVTVTLQWNDPFGASGNDYDLFLHLGDIAVAVGGDFQGGAGDPAEFLTYVNDSPDLQILDLAIGNFNGTAAARTFDMFVLCGGACVPLPDGLFGQPTHNFNTPCSSVSNNADAGGGVLSLSAIDAADPGTNDIEPFSSCGPTNDGRLKPEAAAVDGVTITGSGGFGSPFFGTSAAAPHAAGIAALLFDCNPNLTRTELREALLNKAVDLGPAGPDNDFGYGRLDALASATSAGCTAGGPTATATSTSTPTRTPSRTPTPSRQYGDVNCDGSVSSVDAAVILQLVAGIIGSLNCPQNADVDRDGSATAVDAALILQYVAGLIDRLPP